jgi:formylglycine-generating enzyme required for sulfatase activity
MDWQNIWSWLADQQNREILKFIGGGLAGIVVAGWALYQYFHPRPPPEAPKLPDSNRRTQNLATAGMPVEPALPPIVANNTPIVPVDVAALRTAYLQAMVGEWSTLPLEVLDPKASAVDTAARRLTLEQVYISLDTTTQRPEKLKRKKEAWEQEPPLSAVEVLCHADRQHLVLLGQPGSGKSTFGRYLCLTLAQALLNPGTMKLAEQIPGWTGPAMLPVFVPLRQFAESLVKSSSTSLALSLTDFIRRWVDEREHNFGGLLLQVLRDQEGLVIFDGLDEVAGELRLRVKQALLDFAARHDRCRILLTCRVHSYRQDRAWQLPWEDHTLAEFSPDKIGEFIEAWYNALARLNPQSPIDYGGKKRTLKLALERTDPRRLWELAGTPLLLTIMAIVHTYKELPDSRVGVYRECVDLLLMRWQGARVGNVQRPPLLDALLPHGVTVQKLYQGLREMAYEAHKSGDQARGSGGRALVSDVIVMGAMNKWLGEEGAKVFLDYCRHANGLLLTERVVEREEGITEALYVFPHLSFEEYLAALYLLQQPAAGMEEAVERTGDAAWWDVIRFYGEYLCHDEQGANRYQAKELVEKLCPAQVPLEDQGWRRVRLAGALLPGWKREVPKEDHDDKLQERVVSRLVDLLQTPSALRQDQPARASAGCDLAILGDPRPGVVRPGVDGLPDFQWIRIPGTATVRESRRFPNFTGLRLGKGAKPDPEAQHNENWPALVEPLELQEFELTVYPVTVAQFRPFIEQGGHREDRYWSKTGLEYRGEAPWHWDDPTWTLANHPVIGVSWYEAEAYCNWLNERLPPDQAVRLPTEAEWEWAARGPEGRRYPWGDEWESWRCNSSESGINRTSVVGCFPGSAENYWWKAILPDSGAVHDLAGNVWEWTASEYAEDYSGANQSVLNTNSGSPCVLRGGSWFSGPGGLRGAARHRLYPHSWSGDLGFRLART